MSVAEIPASFYCHNEQLLGVLHIPNEVYRVGVIIVVGGPQYRVGSHRQFVLLARYLALQGIAVLRFDYRGMGDSSGTDMNFEYIDDDIRSAIDWMCLQVPDLKSVVCWGLCDAASANLMYAAKDPRVTGLVLLNPWVRTEATMAHTYLKHYYAKRLFSKDLWLKVFMGRIHIRKSVLSMLGMLRKMMGRQHRNLLTGNNNNKYQNYIERMVSSWEQYAGQVLVILSGNDYVADEFRDLVASSTRWQKMLQKKETIRKDYPEANHTFSTRIWRDQVAEWTWEWLKDRILAPTQTAPMNN